MNKKIISSIVIVLLILGFGVYWFLFRKKAPNFIFQKVGRGDVTQEVSETGSVKVSEKTDLGFKTSGRIEKIYVNVGDNVKAGQALAKLDTTHLSIELSQAKAALEVVKAKDKDANISLQNAEQSLKDAESKEKDDLDNAYGSALLVLSDSYLKAYNAYNLVYRIQKDYFTHSDQPSLEVVDEKYNIKEYLEKINNYVDDVKSNPARENIDLTLQKVKEKLEKIRDSLKIVREATKDQVYRNIVLDSDKALLDTQLLNIDNAISSITNTEQNISTVKIVDETNINNAKAKKISLEAQLEKGNLYQAQIEEAKAKINLLENEISQAVLRAPEDGKIIDINKRKGEMVQPVNSVISFLPNAPYQIEVNIYEEDIVKIKVGDLADINLTAFPNQTLKGKVVSIDPAEKLIEGVVYYKVTIDFLGLKKGVKPGMTADITIKTNERKNVLIVPKEAVESINNQKIVQVLKNGKVENRKIKTGLEGENYYEVVSGLKEGDKVVVGKKV